MTDLIALAARVEAGSGADCELSVLIWCALNNRAVTGPWSDEQGRTGWLCTRNAPPHDVCAKTGEAWQPSMLSTPQYLTSLDAALALAEEMLPGHLWSWELWRHFDEDGGGYEASIDRVIVGGEVFGGTVARTLSASPARALLAAILRAKAPTSK